MIVRYLMQTVGLAGSQIVANKVRAMLTALGIIIGVGAVTSVVAALDGMKQSVLSEFETFGAKKLYVWGQVPRELRGKMSWEKVRLTMEEVEEIQRLAPSVAKLTPAINLRERVVAGAEMKEGVQVTGVWPSWHDIENRFVTMGRPFMSIDEEEKRQVCLVNDLAIDELRLNQDPVGQSILVGGRKFLIVGVVETKDLGAMFGGDETQSEVLVPLSTAVKMRSLMAWPFLIAEATTPEAAEEARAEIRSVLRRMRQLKPGESDTFGTEVMQQHIQNFTAMSAGITMVAGGVVAISLLVGGIGIMNIMLVSVSERTREIGLRKAVGAKPMVILSQFLVEAVVLCLAGGLIGLLVGQALTIGMQNIPDAGLESAAIPAWAIGLSVAFCVVVGVVFGMLPAIKASRLDPIDALRHS